LVAVILLGVVLGVVVGALMLVPVLAYFKRRDRHLSQRTKNELTRMYSEDGLQVDDYHVTLTSEQTASGGKPFLPLSADLDSSSFVSHYDTSGGGIVGNRFQDFQQPYTAGTGCHTWYPPASGAASVGSVPGPTAGGTTGGCYTPTGARGQASCGVGRAISWQRRGDSEHEYELPK
jgi:hypothetical protein